MADLADIEQALRAAHDAGDTENAARLAQAYEEAKAAQQRQQAQNPARLTPAETDVVSGNTSAKLRDYAVEGGWRGLVQGPGQLASAVAQAPFSMYDAARTPTLTEAIAGKQPTVDILGNYNNAVENDRADWERRFEEKYGVPPSRGGLQVAEIIGGLPLGLPEVKGIQGAGNILKAGALTGALGSAAQYQDSSTTPLAKLAWTGGGGVLGVLTGMVPASYAGIRNWMRGFMSGPAVGDTAQRVGTLNRFVPGMADQLSPGQATGNVNVKNFESKLAGTAAQEMLLEQTRMVQDEIKRIAAKYGPVLPPEVAVQRGQLALQNTLERIRQTNSALWKSDIAAMRAKVTTDMFNQAGISGTNQVLVELPGLVDDFASIAKDFKGQLSPSIQNALDDLTHFKGSMRFDTLETLLQKINGRNFTVVEGAANEGANRAAAAQLEQAVMDSLGRVDENTEIGGMLRTMRDGYRIRKANMDEFQQQAAAKILKIDPGTLVDNPEEALRALYNASESQQKTFASVLALQDSQLLGALRGANLRDAAQQAINEAAKPGFSRLDIAKFIQLTVGNGKLRGAGLYSEADRAILQKNLESLNVLLNAPQFKAAVPEVENTAMATSTLSPAFVVRSIYRLMGGKHLDKLFFDPETRNGFMQASDALKTNNMAQFIAAIHGLGSPFVPQEINERNQAASGPQLPGAD